MNGTQTRMFVSKSNQVSVFPITVTEKFSWQNETYGNVIAVLQ